MHRLGNRRAKLLVGTAMAVAALGLLTGCDLQENADTERGEQLFTQKCGTCHALTAAGTNADVGPNLDLAFQASRSAGMDQDTIEGVVQAQIENPRPAAPDDTDVYMPANLVEGEDAEAVAAYVASVAGVPGIKPPEFIAPEFFATNCGGCHTLSAAGTAGTIGPNLDDVLPGQSEDQVATDITDPEAQIAPGFPAGVMPSTYGETLTPEQLKQLVAYLMESVGGGSGK
jgi:mono/diheme cytochrome c family protein